MIDGGQESGAVDFRSMAGLHADCLPDSLFTALGRRFLACYYRFVAVSQRDWLFAEKHEGRWVGGCVLSLETHSLFRRVLFAKPFVTTFGLVCACLGRASVRARLFAGLRPSVTPKAVMGMPEVVQLFTDESLRGTGVGRRLLKAAEARLLQLGARAYFVKTADDPGNPAVPFYRRGCFVEVARELVNGKPYLYLVKSLSAHESSHGR